MHSAFLWCSCHFEDMFTPALMKLIKPEFNPKFFPEFFGLHLTQDINHLSRLTGRAIEEAAIIVHMVLHDILTKTLPTCMSE